MTAMPTKPDLRRRRLLDVSEILRWVDRHKGTTGFWPTKDAGGVIGTVGETWLGIDGSLRNGTRGLPGGSSLARLLEERRGVRNRKALPWLTEEQILDWADAHHDRTGTWPTADSGPIPNSSGDKWSSVQNALRLGLRGLPGGSSLARLLARHRGVRNRKGLPPFTIEQILAWADAHHARTGTWPQSDAGPIAEAPGETWMAVEMALSHGQRGLSGGSSLAWLLAERRSVDNYYGLTRLTVDQILAWADAYYRREGRWPTAKTEPIPESGDTWAGVDSALKKGTRGLTGGSSLARLLAQERGVRNWISVPQLHRKQILAWADAHRERTGDWPSTSSGPITDAPGETWSAVDAALKQGSRGLRGRSSLACLLATHRGVRNIQNLPPLSKKKILAWADEHHARTGRWPNVNSGPVAAAPGERWDLIDNALRAGHRGQPGGSSLHRLLVKKRGLRNLLDLPPLTEELILQWADDHYQRTGRWPHAKAGPVAAAPGEVWSGVDHSLRYGKRSLPGGSSLAKLLDTASRKPAKYG